MTFIAWLERVVRSGELPDRSDLIITWFVLTTAKPTEPLLNQLNTHHRQVLVLLDAIADDLVPTSWRRCCVNNINRPMNALSQLVRCDCNRRALNQLEHEVRQTLAYYEPALSNPYKQED
ncbi:MAG: hypothetical protein AAF499_12850 [Pseudomonadota bacterium]